MTNPTLEPSLYQRRGAWARQAVKSPTTNLQAQMGKVFDYLKGLHATHLISTGVRLGLFQRLSKESGGIAPHELSADLHLDEAYVRMWCETACALELLDYDPETGYHLAPFMDQVLGLPGSTYYLGDFPQAHLVLARDYARYPELFITGERQPFWEHDNRFLHGVAKATRVLPRMFIDAVAPQLTRVQAKLEEGARILDVGCGGGHAIVEFASRYPRVRCIGLEIDSTSVRMAQALIDERGLWDRVEVRRVDDYRLPEGFAGAFDLVTSFLILHKIQPHNKGRVLEQCVQALRQDGLLLLFDECYPSTPGDLRDPARISAVVAQWYEMTWGNIINTNEEIHKMLARRGLSIINETSLSPFYIVTAQKRRERR